MDSFKHLNIKGFHLNSNICSELNSVYYDCDDNEDNWVEIIPDSLADGSYVVIIVVGGQNKKVFAFDGNNEQLERTLSGLLKELGLDI